jgi:hypothetical protein
MTNNTTIEVPVDPEEAVRLLRHELRGARRRLAEARHTAGLARFRALAEAQALSAPVTRTASTTGIGHGVSAGFPR